ncbi:hypothetical protein [Kordiimonas pumila]|uniref:Uncharacterized protein n=1 Tax=Kordiimonas pumila TaxID=2161677 RepID=A0ABV7D550_9PROT|nr:hypothetical protein [Kordiimonas pumila]
MTKKVDFSSLISVDDLVSQAPALKLGTVREWLFHRKSNMLSSAVLKIDDNVWLDIDRFNIWLSLDKDEVSDFRNLRTKEQLLKSCHIKASKLEDWLRKRHWNGLEEAVIKKGERKIYIDIHKFNHWLWEQNSNPDFGAAIA